MQEWRVGVESGEWSVGVVVRVGAATVAGVRVFNQARKNDPVIHIEVPGTITVQVDPDTGAYQVCAPGTRELLATATQPEEVVEAIGRALEIIDEHSACSFCALYSCEGRDDGECPWEVSGNVWEGFSDRADPAAAHSALA